MRAHPRLRWLALLPVAALLAVAACEWCVHAAARGRVYGDVSALPARRVGLVLGTGKRVGRGQPNPFYARRIEAAAELLRAGKIQYLLVSGDNSRRDYDEPSAMKRDLVAQGVGADRIYCDYAGFRTLDSMIRARRVFGLTDCTVISQRFHCERAVFLARSCDLDAIGFAAQDVVARDAIRTLLRERLARIAAVLDAWVWHRGPKFLGPPVVIGKDPPPGTAQAGGRSHRAPTPGEKTRPRRASQPARVCDNSWSNWPKMMAFCEIRPLQCPFCIAVHYGPHYPFSAH